MKPPFTPLLLSLTLALPAAADNYQELSLYPDCRKLTPAEVDPRDWFPQAPRSERERLRQNSRQHYADARAMAERLLSNPQDEAAFCALYEYTEHINDLVDELTDDSPENQSKLATLLKFRQIHRVAGLSDTRLLALRDKPRQDFIIRLRDLLQGDYSREQLIRELYSILEHDSELNHAEIDIICRGLRAWCGVSNSHRPAGAVARLYLREFRGGKEVQLSSPMEHDISVHYPHLRRFVSAECAINGTVAKMLSFHMSWNNRALNRLLWRSPEKAVVLARHMQRPGYDLLEHKPEALRRYMRFCGIAQYRQPALEVPECCSTALDIRESSTAEDVREQIKSLPTELKPLAPRCLLALGRRDEQVWEPATLSPHTPISPAWPDASAVQLPQWRNSLLGLADGADVQAAFEQELQQLSAQTEAVTKYHGTGYLLACALDECERVRPDRRDLITPVYVRIALRFEQDGVTLSYLPEDDSFGISADYGLSSLPILNTAQHLVPQHLHRITLQLALLEKEGRTQEMEKACARLARVLNRSNLWPLIICQRELRGFSTRALLTLFAHYEGEDDALFDYGEAMGLRHEMSIARLGHEDELGDNLLRAAAISGALPASEQERQAAIDAFMAMAREHAYDNNPRLTGEVLLHLLRWGVTEPLMQWHDCPVRYFRGRYATNGLRLIRAYLKNNRHQDAERLLAAMGADAETDTTPAYRLACALMAQDTATAARLRKDALLLAMLHRHIDYTTYADYLTELAVEGDEQNYIMRSELMFSNGRSAGLSPELAFCYAGNGRWDSAHFVFEYMLTQGLTTITPYGTIPDQAHMFYYRAFADICRSKAQNRPEWARQALAALAGTPAETVAKELAALPAEGNNATNTAPSTQPHTAPNDLLAALPPRTWKLKNGSTIEGQLIGLGRGKYITLRLSDGSARMFPMGEIAGNELPYFNNWSKANGIQNWNHNPSETNHVYKVKTAGRPVGAMPDLEHPGSWYMAVVGENGAIHWLRTWGLTGKEAEQATAFCKEQGKSFAAGLQLADSPQQALRMAQEHRLPILLVSTISAMGGFNDIQGLIQYMQFHPQATAIWAQQYVILPVTPPMGKERPLRYPEQQRNELLELERVFTPGITAENSHTGRMLDASLRKSGKVNICLLSPGKVTSYTLAPDVTVAPADILLNGSELTEQEKKY